MLKNKCTLHFLRREEQNVKHSLSDGGSYISYDEKHVFGKYIFRKHLKKANAFTAYGSSHTQQNPRNEATNINRKTSLSNETKQQKLKNNEFAVTAVSTHIQETMKRRGAILRMYEHKVKNQKYCKSSLLDQRLRPSHIYRYICRHPNKQ